MDRIARWTRHSGSMGGALTVLPGLEPQGIAIGESLPD